MRSESVFLAALAAAATVVGQTTRPKIYFPRHVKRQYTNGSAPLTTLESTTPQSTPEVTSSSTELKRQSSISDIISSFTHHDGSSTSGSDPSIVISVSPSLLPSHSTDPSSETTHPASFSSSTTPPESSFTLAPPQSSSSNVPADSSTGAIPSSIVQPTTSSNEATPTTSSGVVVAPSSSSSSIGSSGILIAPSGIVSSSPVITSSQALSTPSSSSVEPATIVPVNPLSFLSSVVGDATSIVSEITSGLNLNPTAPTLSSTTTAPPVSSSSSQPLLSLSLPLSELTSGIGSIIPTSIPTTFIGTNPASSYSSATESGSGSPASSGTASASDIGIGITLGSSPTSVAGVSPTGSVSGTGVTGSQSGVSPTGSLSGTGVSPSGTSSVVAGISPTGSFIGTGVTSSPAATSMLASSAGISPSGSVSGTGFSSPTAGVSSGVLPPATSNSTTEVPSVASNTAIPSSVSQNSTESAPTILPATSTSDTATSSSEIPTVVPVTSSTTSNPAGVVSQTATATFTTSQPWLPSTIVVDASTTSFSTGGAAASTSSSVPSALPKAITPDTGTGDQPADTTLIQICFNYGLNYPFMVANPKSAAQVFQVLPAALASGGDVNQDLLVMQELTYLDTRASLGFLTTCAIVTYPSSMVDALQLDIRLPTSRVYNQPNALQGNLTAQINPAISIIIGSYSDDTSSSTGSSGSGGSGSGTGSNSDPFTNSSNNPSSSQKGITAGIVAGSVAVAGAYGAAMFIIARRYKRKKQAHRRASSLTGSDPSMTQQAPSPALMGGALLSRDFSNYGGVAGGRESHGSHGSGPGISNSGRSAFISAPMAAENSLGWN